MAGPPNRSGLIAGEGIHLMAPGARQLRLCEIRPVAVVLMSSLPHGLMAVCPGLRCPVDVKSLQGLHQDRPRKRINGSMSVSQPPVSS